MESLKLCGIVIIVCVACSASQTSQEHAAVTATIEEVPQRPMTLKNGYHPGLFPFNKGEPFVVDPNMGSIDFNTKPPNQRSDEYYDYDTKLEEVPYDYKGDPIDRKDVVEPNLPRPNDIKPNNNKNKQTDIYQFLNLPVKYSSSDKFPLMSSSYANTKVQGSGSSSLSNHKMPQTSTSTTVPTNLWYNSIKTTVKPTTITRPTTTPVTTTTTATTTTTTTTTAPPQEYEEESNYDYDYFHLQESASSESTVVTTSTTNNPTTTVHHSSPSFITPEPTTTTSTTTTPVSSTTSTTTEKPYSTSVVLNKTSGITTTSRPEIDSKLDGTSFADYDTIKSTVKEHQEYSQNFKPLPGNYQFDDKKYPLITNSKVPMTFTAHVSSGISLNQKEHLSNIKPPVPVSESAYSSRPLQPDSNKPHDSNKPQEPKYDNSRLTPSIQPDTSISSPESSTYLKPKPSRPNSNDQFETVYYKIRPETYPQQFTSTISSRPVNPSTQSRPYQPELTLVKTSHIDINRKPLNSELQISQGRPQSYPVQPEVYMKNKPQYTPPQSQPDTSKFKPPKHVINHFIKTQPNEDNKSYALQTSFSIGMDGERTETRPQGIGQVLMVEDSSTETVVNQTIPVRPKSTTSIPLVPPPRPVQKQQPYPRPPWENIQKPPSYYPSPKRDSVPPPQRQNLPNILPQFRPNAKVDTAPMVPQSHSATIERVQIPTDHLRPPPLPKPQFLKIDRTDENIDEEILDIPEKETRILQRIGPQPAKVTTLQMIQHGAPVNTKVRDDNKENPVHIIYAANSPPKQSEKLVDDSVLLDIKDRSDVPILKTKTIINKPIKTDFPYQIVKPDENQNTSALEYNAYSPTKSDYIKPNNEQELVPNLQDYVPIATRDSTSNIAIPQKLISATLKTSEDNNHKSVDEGHKPLLQNFQIPFQPSLKLPENSNGWSVVRKSQTDNASERIDETGDAIASTEKFDPDNFKPQLVGGFMPISSPVEETKEKKTEPSERAK
jgi:hypothetical protein